MIILQLFLKIMQFLQQVILLIVWVKERHYEHWASTVCIEAVEVLR
jgi:hypothetical protein